jgi:hypothetical protein
MTDHFCDLGLPTRSNLTIQPLREIQGGRDKLPSPSFIAETMAPEFFSCEWRKWLYSVSNKAARGMAIQSQQEWYKKVVRVPEGFI